MKTLSKHITESLQQTAEPKQEIRIVYFEGSDQFDSEKVLITYTEAKEHATDKLLKQWSYRKTDETLWCEFYLAGKKLDEFHDRIKIKNGKVVK